MVAETLDVGASNGTLVPKELPVPHDRVFHFTDLGLTKPQRVGDPYDYQAGFGNHFESELIPGTLPIGQSHPHVCRFSLYTEVLTASAFAAPRHSNFTTVLYRTRPSCASGECLPA